MGIGSLYLYLCVSLKNFMKPKTKCTLIFGHWWYLAGPGGFLPPLWLYWPLSFLLLPWLLLVALFLSAQSLDYCPAMVSHLLPFACMLLPPGSLCWSSRMSALTSPSEYPYLSTLILYSRSVGPVPSRSGYFPPENWLIVGLRMLDGGD
jgi:hypothetical protein